MAETNTPRPAPIGADPFSLRSSNLDVAKAKATTEAIEEVNAKIKTNLAKPITGVSARVGSRLKNKLVGLGENLHSKPVGATAVTDPVHFQKQDSKQRGTFEYACPQFTGFRLAPRETANSSSETGNKDGEEDKKAIPCGMPVVAEASFRLQLTTGEIVVIHKGDIVEDAGLISLIISLNKPIRVATQEELDEYSL